MLPTTNLQNIKGVGPVLYAKFEKAGLTTVENLAEFYPRRYEDFSGTVSIDNIEPGKITLRAKVESVSSKTVRRGMNVTTAVISDDTGKINVVWFNQFYRAKQLKIGEEYFFTGVYEFRYNRFQLSSPSVEQVSEHADELDKIIPVYSSSGGLRNKYVRKALKTIRPSFDNWPEILPEQVIKHAKVIANGEALTKIHFPESDEDVKIATERLSFNELFELTLASQLNKNENSKLKGWNIPFNKEAVLKLIESLPFKLTNAQRIAAWEIIQDFNKPHPMNRLLQGDVGSGKTVVAGIAATQAISEGLQAAVLAPTDILATQHAETLQNMLANSGVTVGLLTGRVKGKARELIYKQIANGEVDIVVGTHAIIQDKLNFHKLGLVVIDEQHRFGVKQRQALLQKSKNLPHLLSMTATPIPRSLALTVYGELDVSILDQLPSGRKAIKTKIWSPNSTEALFQDVKNELSAGRQAYYICNLIEESSASAMQSADVEIKNVEKQYKLLKNKYFKEFKVGMLHGKMNALEKQQIMDDFSTHKIDILVSTTVVEVGVDVPNATVIMIENADRFGLAQLHQLRGRVGRSTHQSYAYLINSDSSAPTRRLKELEKSNDGFYLAEVDLKMRGPGEIYGRSQHGDLNLKIATLANTRQIVKARKAAEYFLEKGGSLNDYPELNKKIKKYQRITTLN